MHLYVPSLLLLMSASVLVADGPVTKAFTLPAPRGKTDRASTVNSVVDSRKTPAIARHKFLSNTCTFGYALSMLAKVCLSNKHGNKCAVDKIVHHKSQNKHRQYTEFSKIIFGKGSEPHQNTICFDYLYNHIGNILKFLKFP